MCRSFRTLGDDFRPIRSPTKSLRSHYEVTFTPTKSRSHPTKSLEVSDRFWVFWVDWRACKARRRQRLSPTKSPTKSYEVTTKSLRSHVHTFEVTFTPYKVTRSHERGLPVRPERLALAMPEPNPLRSLPPEDRVVSGVRHHRQHQARAHLSPSIAR